MVGDTGIYNCVVKDHEHYDKTAPLLSIPQMIQYLDDHGLYQDPTTGMTHADGIAAERLCNWLWDRTRAHLEYGQDGTPELEYSGAVSR